MELCSTHSKVLKSATQESLIAVNMKGSKKKYATRIKICYKIIGSFRALLRHKNYLVRTCISMPAEVLK
jgi:hypothetical protein